LIEVDAPETPGLDGSSLAYVEALTAAGTTLLDHPRPALMIEQHTAVRDGATLLLAQPAAGSVLELEYHLEYPAGHPIGSQSFELAVSPETFRNELAASRTFLLEAEAQELRRTGIGKRATESDLLVFGPEGVLGNSLRQPNECARHKMLDLVGDLALLEMDVHGRLIAHRSGHQHNASLVRLLAGMARSDRSAA
jgi:UDP-3-O-acyl-N-acetylglucosamine deacetylase